jgi:hypothetical protein
MTRTLLDRQSEFPRAALVSIYLLACPHLLARLGSAGERAGREQKQTTAPPLEVLLSPYPTVSVLLSRCFKE